MECTLTGVRRLVASLVALAALVLAAEVSAALQPVTREFGELSVPLVREASSPAVSDRAGDDRIRVLVRLRAHC